MKDNIIDEQEGNELKEVYQYYPNEKDKIEKSTKFKVEDVFKDNLGLMVEEEGLTKKMITKIIDFLTENPNQY